MKNKKLVFWFSVIGIIVVILIVLGGIFLFKNDKMSCTSNVKDDFRTTDETVEIYYNDIEVKKVIQKTKHTFNDKESLYVFKDFLDESVENMREAKHVGTTKNNDNLIYETTVKINVSRLDEKELVNLHVSSNLVELKNILKEKGFECKTEK